MKIMHCTNCGRTTYNIYNYENVYIMQCRECGKATSILGQKKITKII